MSIDNTPVLIGQTRHGYHTTNGIDGCEMGICLHVFLTFARNFKTLGHHMIISIIPAVIIPSGIHRISNVIYITCKGSSRTYIARPHIRIQILYQLIFPRISTTAIIIIDGLHHRNKMHAYIVVVLLQFFVTYSFRVGIQVIECTGTCGKHGSCQQRSCRIFQYILHNYKSI